MPGKLYNTTYPHIILLLLVHACALVASFTPQYTYGFNRLRVLASPWSPSTTIRSTTETTGESHSQPLLKYRQGCMGSGSDRELQPECNLVPGPSTSGQAPVHSVPASEVATSEQLSSLNVPQATPPPAAAVTLTASNNNAVSPTNLPGITASVAAAESDQPTASDPAVNLGNVTPVGLSQVSAVLRQSTTYTPESSNNVPDPTKLPALEETQPSPTVEELPQQHY